MVNELISNGILIGIFALVVNNAFRIGRIEGILKVHFDPPKKTKER